MNPTYLSQDKLDELKKELEWRKTEERRNIADKIEQAKELGDLSENFEYHEAKEQQARNESRILELQDMIQNAVIVEEKSGGETIGLGTKFVVEIGGAEKTFEMVGSQEADPLSGKISNETPVGQEFLGKKVGDEFAVDLPTGAVTYKVIKIL